MKMKESISFKNVKTGYSVNIPEIKDITLFTGNEHLVPVTIRIIGFMRYMCDYIYAAILPKRLGSPLANQISINPSNEFLKIMNNDYEILDGLEIEYQIDEIYIKMKSWFTEETNTMKIDCDTNIIEAGSQYVTLSFGIDKITSSTLLELDQISADSVESIFNKKIGSYIDSMMLNREVSKNIRDYVSGAIASVQCENIENGLTPETQTKILNHLFDLVYDDSKDFVHKRFLFGTQSIYILKSLSIRLLENYMSETDIAVYQIKEFGKTENIVKDNSIDTLDYDIVMGDLNRKIKDLKHINR